MYICIYITYLHATIFYQCSTSVETVILFITWSYRGTKCSHTFVNKTNQTFALFRPPSDRSLTRRANLAQAPCSTRSYPCSCRPPWRTRNAICWSRLLTESCTNWTIWCGPTSTKSWWSLSPCSLTRTTMRVWRAEKLSPTWQR